MFYRIEKKELNLLAAYNRKEGPNPAEKYAKIILPPLVLILAVGGSFAWINTTNQRLQAEVDGLQAQNDALQAQIDAIGLDAYNELTEIEASFANVEKINAGIKTLPQVTKLKILGLELALLGGMEIKTLNYDQVSGVLSATYSSVYVTNIEKYVSAIKSNPLYSNVIYKGYQQKKEKETIETGVIDELTGEFVTEEKESITYSFEVKLTLGGN